MTNGSGARQWQLFAPWQTPYTYRRADAVVVFVYVKGAPRGERAVDRHGWLDGASVDVDESYREGRPYLSPRALTEGSCQCGGRRRADCVRGSVLSGAGGRASAHDRGPEWRDLGEEV